MSGSFPVCHEIWNLALMVTGSSLKLVNGHKPTTRSTEVIHSLCRTVMKSGPEIVKAGLRSFFESAADDIEKMVENLKLGKVSTKNQVKDEPEEQTSDVFTAMLMQHNHMLVVTQT